MREKGKSFSIIRLNQYEAGWGVVDDASGALVHIDSLAMRLTKERAKLIAAELNAEAAERGTAAVPVAIEIDPKDPAEVARRQDDSVEPDSVPT